MVASETGVPVPLEDRSGHTEAPGSDRSAADPLEGKPMSPSEFNPDRRWIALALLAMAQFVVVLDASIVNVALPSIGTDLQISQDNLSWVVNAYVLAFGGLLLLGGRMADLLGRRTIFMSGLILFAIASLLGG